MDLLAFSVTLLLVLDPFGNLPLFQSVLARVPEAARRRVLARELLVALAVLLLFLFAGAPLLGFLGLDAHTLSISGAIVLFLIALGMVFPGRSLHGSDTEADEPFIVPLAVPFMAGPSSIALLLLVASKEPQALGWIAVATVAAWLPAAVILWFSPLVLRLLGKKGSRAMERLMGLLLIMVAVQMFLDGLAEYQGGVTGGG